MSTVWPAGKGPYAGKCACGGTVHLHWKDKITAEYYCDKCGIVTTHPGKKDQLPREDVRHVVDTVWRELGLAQVEYRPFLILVDQVCFQTMAGRFPVISIKEFERWGYVIVGTHIRKSG